MLRAMRYNRESHVSCRVLSGSFSESDPSTRPLKINIQRFRYERK